MVFLKIIGCIKCYIGNKYLKINFHEENKNKQKYENIWDKIRLKIKVKNHCKLDCDDKLFRIKINSFYNS